MVELVNVLSEGTVKLFVFSITISFSAVVNGKKTEKYIAYHFRVIVKYNCFYIKNMCGWNSNKLIKYDVNVTRRCFEKKNVTVLIVKFIATTLVFFNSFNNTINTIHKYYKTSYFTIGYTKIVLCHLFPLLPEIRKKIGVGILKYIRKNIERLIYEFILENKLYGK